MNDTKTNRSYYNEAEAAEYLQVDPRTLQRWRSENIGPSYTRIGQRVVYRKVSIERWLRDNEIKK